MKFSVSGWISQVSTKVVYGSARLYTSHSRRLNRQTAGLRVKHGAFWASECLQASLGPASLSLGKPSPEGPSTPYFRTLGTKNHK